MSASVTLAKSTDNKITSPFESRQWQGTVDLFLALTTIFGRATGNRLYEGLSDNNPRTLADTLAYWTRYDNTTGTLVPRTSGVSLAKVTDNDGSDHYVTGGDTTKIDNYLGAWYGPMSDQTRDDLARNDLRGLDNVLYLMVWDPTPGQ
jgi:hypothetical protein